MLRGGGEGTLMVVVEEAREDTLLGGDDRRDCYVLPPMSQISSVHEVSPVRSRCPVVGVKGYGYFDVKHLV